MLNVTAVFPSGPGYLTVFPCGSPQPLASNVNYPAGQVVPNAVLAKVGTDGKVCIFTLADTDLVVDVNGYVPAGGSPSTVVPARLLETRWGRMRRRWMACSRGAGVAAGSVFELTVTDRGGGGACGCVGGDVERDGGVPVGSWVSDGVPVWVAAAVGVERELSGGSGGAERGVGQGRHRRQGVHLHVGDTDVVVDVNGYL